MSPIRAALRVSLAELRSSGRPMLLVMLSFALGVSVLVSLMSLRESLNAALEIEAKALLGADLLVTSSRPLPTETLGLLQQSGASLSEELSFSSMLLVPESGISRLVQVRALRGSYPFYGTIETSPDGSLGRIVNGPGGEALLDETLFVQLQTEVGDQLQLGSLSLKLVGQVSKFPGASYARMMIVPSVYIPLTDAEKTGLLQKGSRVSYKYYVALTDPLAVSQLEANLQALKYDQRFEIETVASRKQSIGRAMDNVARYLQLLGFVALVLGAIGIGSAINSLIARRLQLAANLRCLGFTQREVFAVYSFLTASIASVASLIGILASLLLNRAILAAFAEFLPIGTNLKHSLSPSAAALGFFGGISLSLAFAAFALLKVRAVSPLEALRAAGGIGDVPRGSKALAVGVVLVLLTTLSVLSSQSLKIGIGFVLAFILLTLILLGLVSVLLQAVSASRSALSSFVVKQGLTALFRPSSQTRTLVLTIGLGTLLVVMISLVRAMLVEQVSFAGAGARPNLILFDVQIDQIPAVEQLLTQRKFPIVQQVPIVTMRLLSINGQSNEKLRADPEIPEWTLRREYRSTYREKLIESEEVLEGDWSEQYSAGSVVPVSVEEGIAKDLKLKLNDRIIFDVQGVQIETQVTSIRKVDWRRVQTNFFFVFPAGVLEEAPQFFAITTRAPNKHASAEIQRELVYRLPNVSAIDLNLILETADGVLDKAASVITFLALFTLLAGFIVLAGSVAATRSARLRETLLLRTLGATRREIVLISLVEFTVLGLLAAGVGLGLASACSWLLAEYYFQASYLAEWRVVFGVGFSVLGVVILSGIVTSWRLSREIPISVLRVEVS